MSEKQQSVFRIVFPIATVVALIIGSITLTNWLNGKFASVTGPVQEIRSDIKSIIKLQEIQQQQLADHEARIRELEREKRLRP